MKDDSEVPLPPPQRQVKLVVSSEAAAWKALSRDLLVSMELSELRSLGAALGALGRQDCISAAELQDRYVFGREELVKRVPMRMQLSQLSPNSRNDMLGDQSIVRFISRHCFQIRPWSGDSDSQHLDSDREDPPIASISGLVRGLHLQQGRGTAWRWLEQGQASPVCHGDRVALLIDAPPGVSNQTLTLQEATVLLFVQFER